MYHFCLLFRCATGEAWPDIMLDATSGRDCDPENIERNMTTGEMLNPDQNCGSLLTYLYFVSFVFQNTSKMILSGFCGWAYNPNSYRKTGFEDNLRSKSLLKIRKSF